MMTLAARLLDFIKSYYESVQKYAEITGEDYNTIHRYVKGSSMPGVEKLIKFQETGLSIDWLITGSGKKFARNPAGIKLMEENPEYIKLKPIRNLRYCH